jgi:hypothetical protein
MDQKRWIPGWLGACFFRLIDFEPVPELSFRVPG